MKPHATIPIQTSALIVIVLLVAVACYLAAKNILNHNDHLRWAITSMGYEIQETIASIMKRNN